MAVIVVSPDDLLRLDKAKHLCVIDTLEQDDAVTRQVDWGYQADDRDNRNGFGWARRRRKTLPRGFRRLSLRLRGGPSLRLV